MGEKMPRKCPSKFHLAFLRAFNECMLEECIYDGRIPEYCRYIHAKMKEYNFCRVLNYFKRICAEYTQTEKGPNILSVGFNQRRIYGIYNYYIQRERRNRPHHFIEVDNAFIELLLSVDGIDEENLIWE